MFIGRETYLKELLDKLTRHEGPLTLVGPVGVGKSAVAAQVLRQLRPSLAGVRHIDFAQNPSTAKETLKALLDAPPKAHTLILLDNVDRELTAVRAALNRLQESPHALFLVTARTRLGYIREGVAYVPPLTALEAVALLRLVAATQGAHPQTWDPIAMARIVRQLDYLPLAIELCARFAVTTQLNDIARQLSSNCNWLENPCVDCPPQHKSLTTALRDALEGLPASVFDCLRRLSLFQGRFTLDDVLACTPSDGLDPGPLAELTVLHERSLVQFDFHVGCYTLLNSVRWYVRHTAAADASANACFHEFLCRGAERSLANSPEHGAAWLVRHRHSLLEAWETHPHSVAKSAALLVAAARAAAWCGPVAPVLDALQRARLEGCDALPVLVRARLLHAQAKLYERTGDTELAMRTYELTRTLTREPSTSDESSAEYCEFRLDLSLDLGGLYHQRGDARAHECYAEAITQSQNPATSKKHARLWATLATRATERHELDDARRLFERASHLLREKSELVEGMMLSNRGVLHQELRNTAEARADFERARNLHHQLGHQRFEAVAEFDLGCLAIEDEHYTVAQRHFEAALTLASEADDRSQAALALTLLATASLNLPTEQAHAEQAAQWLRDAFTVLERIGNPYLLAAHRVHSAQLHANAACTAFIAGDVAAYERELRAAEEVLDQPQPQTSDEVRLATRLLRSTLERCSALHHVVLISTDGSWLQKPPAERLALKPDSPSQRLLNTLMSYYTQDPTQCVAIEVLVRRAWPTQHASAKSAMNRLHVALNTLRKHGLADHLQHTAAGYVLRNVLPRPGPRQ